LSIIVLTDSFHHSNFLCPSLALLAFSVAASGPLKACATYQQSFSSGTGAGRAIKGKFTWKMVVKIEGGGGGLYFVL